jgi:hypothetical protein
MRLQPWRHRQAFLDGVGDGRLSSGHALTRIEEKDMQSKSIREDQAQFLLGQLE